MNMINTQITLPQNTVDLWLVQPNEVTDAELLVAYDKLMNEQEREKQQRYRFAGDRHDALITRAFARTVLSKYAPVAPQDWQFVKGDKGKPEIANPPLPLRFNISHTKGLIICAVALHVDLGVDVEYIKRKSSTIKIAEYKFSPVEVAELKSLPEARQRNRFFDYWTLKESYIKAVGGGLSIPLDEFSFTIIDDNHINIAFDEKRNDDASQWQSWLMHATQDHRIALSLKDPNKQPHQIRCFQTIPLVKDWTPDLPLE
ncbi:MAG: 4'-phosphopantetheinyl transferase superfamily protein [Algicola sp.]|nr:4'-phosphopantetheinyl transferase superfamily protein [Algicola sp.]